mmetsp:Transcript_12524/g.17405  ORF Transcript_12524/g.17405 Transcript_12524/m.17405 type:complete len:148 (+) Transcript_12524:173-616(+)
MRRMLKRKRNHQLRNNVDMAVAAAAEGGEVVEEEDEEGRIAQTSPEMVDKVIVIRMEVEREAANAAVGGVGRTKTVKAVLHMREAGGETEGNRRGRRRRRNPFHTFLNSGKSLSRSLSLQSRRQHQIRLSCSNMLLEKLAMALLGAR